MDQGFGAAEHLKSRKLIEGIFRNGKAIKAFPVVAVYVTDPTVKGVQVAFSVPKKRFKWAVDRNLHKRWLREAYRLQRNACQIHELNGLAVMFIYVTNEVGSYKTIEASMKKILGRLREQNSPPGQTI